MLSASSVPAVAPIRLAAILTVAAAMLGIAGLLSPVAAATHAVEIGDGFFGPASLTVTVGDTVTWTNGDDSPHTVTADGTFDSGNVDPGQTFSHTFTAPGTFTYVCRYHDEMVATITVVESAAAPAASVASVSASAAPATSGTAEGANAPASQAAGEHGAGQPDTALPSPLAAAIPAWIAPLLIGLGLVALAVAVVPSLPAFRATETRGARAPSEGWRR